MANEVVLLFLQYTQLSTPLGLSLNYDVNGNIAKGTTDQRVEFFHPGDDITSGQK